MLKYSCSQLCSRFSADAGVCSLRCSLLLLDFGASAQTSLEPAEEPADRAQELLVAPLLLRVLPPQERAVLDDFFVDEDVQDHLQQACGDAGRTSGLVAPT